ncbi:MAG TPA: DegT/DnrJ/EryC1/StrS aminotransferase family protein [Haliangiales bacterium]|nr:DegT/DnrJ/EryC1/StrS aminotransferase family protein [Haliangiales bacterium]
MTDKIPFARPMLGDEEIAEVVDTLRSGWLTTGPKTRRLEQAFAAEIGVPFALGTNSCTAALHLGLAALGVGPGDEVIVPTMTFAATANVVVHCGATPVLVDVRPDTLDLDPARAAERIGPRTRAVMAVHYAGRPSDVAALRRLCDERGLAFVEDAAHAVGARVGGRAVGSFGDFAGFSFYANKNMTTGEGGMLTTASEALAARARVLRLQGMTRDVYHRAGGALPSWRYDIVAAGFKFPMSDIEAAIGIHQLAKLPAHQARRRELAARYDAGLAGVPGLAVPPPLPAGVEHAWHLYVVRVARGARRDRDALFAALAERGIECSVHFVPLHMQPYYRDLSRQELPVAEAAFAEILSLPLWPGLTDAQQERVIESIRALLA